MQEKFYKYQGAGTDFLIVDNRAGHLKEIDGVLYGEGWSSAIGVTVLERMG